MLNENSVLTIDLIDKLCVDAEQWQSHHQRLQASSSLSAIVWAAFQIGLWLARGLVEQELERRAQIPTHWPCCDDCGHRLRSKGFRVRQLSTWVGVIHWRRRVGRCPGHCQGSSCIPLDEALGISAYQQTGIELERLGCLLSVFVPFGLASELLEQLSGLSVSASSLWNWVQKQGQQASEQLEKQLSALSAGESIETELLDEALAHMLLVMGADGVMVPMRPHGGSPKGKIQWQEVKVAVLARLGQHLTSTGKLVNRLYQRRLVAMLGSIDEFAPRFELEALRQGVRSAPQVVWMSDGGKGFWRLYYQYFAAYAVGILDFYHAAGHLWRAAAAWLDGRTSAAKWCFARWRHLLRHGGNQQVLTELTQLINRDDIPKSALETLVQVQQYIQSHRRHINYQAFDKQAFPLGSGLVESACKWLIQQRFKGVGMRWSEEGLNHLLLLRLAWVNQRFDDLFPEDAVRPNLYAPNL